jgi:hypothetical protein
VKTLCQAIAVVLLMSARQAAAATLTLDDFENPMPAEVILAGITHENGIPLQHSGLPLTVGGQRDVKINVDGTPKPNSAQVLIGHDEELFLRGVLQVATASSPGSIVTLQYDGLDSNPVALTNSHGLNMVVAPDGGITIDFLTVDAPEIGLLDVAIRLYSNDAVATFSGAVPETAVPLSFYADYDEFDVGEGFSFDTVDSFEFVFNGSALVDIDFVVDSISTTVPEPGTLAIACLGIVAAFVVRRRSR